MEGRSKAEEGTQFALWQGANLTEKVFDQKLEGGEGERLPYVLYLREKHSGRKNKQCAPKMGGLGAL